MSDVRSQTPKYSEVSNESFVQAVKSVWQFYRPSEEVLDLLEHFRRMVNDCIRIGLAENLTSMKSLSKKTYHQLGAYPIPAHYRLTANSKAAGLLSNYRKSLRKHPNTKKPYANKLILSDCYLFRIHDGKLRLNLGGKRYFYIRLTSYVLKSILDYAVRSITLTACTVSISFSKETALMEPKGLIGIDRNLDNITTADSKGQVTVFDLSKATKIKQRCRETKSHFKRNDVRIRQRLFEKYGRLQRNHVQWLLHNASRQIINVARENCFGIVLENIKGIRKLYRKGNGQGSNYRGRMNSWSYYELQRQIEYKARWNNLPVVFVDARGTSKYCAVCGCELSQDPNAQRQLWCQKCGVSVDRDVNAARNILIRGAVRFAADGLPSEAMVTEPSSQEVLLVVDGKKVIQEVENNAI